MASSLSRRTPNTERKVDIVIPVMGPTGAGKSTFINYVLKEKRMKVGHKTTSCTSEPHPVAVVDPIPGFSNYRLVLLDTPGFDDTHEDDVEILKRIANWLAESCRQGNLVGGVLYLHDISAKRFTGTARQNLGMFSRLCGDAALHKTCLVTTKWGPEPVSQVFTTREEEMKTEHWKALFGKGVVVHRFLRDETSAERIIKSLLDHIITESLLDLQIQTELVVNRMTIPETEAGKELRYTLKQLLKMQRQALEEKAWAASGDSEEKAKLDAARIKLDRIRDQVQELRVELSLSRRFLKPFGFQEIKQGRIPEQVVFPDEGGKYIVILVMGPVGAGKSTFINIASGEERMKVGTGTTGCTTRPSAVSIKPPASLSLPKDQRLMLVDTPGFDDSHESDVEILKRIANWLADSYRRKMVIGGVLYLHDISIKRYTDTFRKNLEIFSSLCGNVFVGKAVLATTNWEPQTMQDLEQREDEMKAIHWKAVIDKGVQVRRFLRDSQSAWDIISLSLRRSHIAVFPSIPVDPLQIQEELVDRRMLIPETEAGKQLRYTLEQLREIQKEIVEYERSGMARGDPEAKARLVELQARIQDRIQSSQPSIKKRLSTTINNLLVSAG